MLTLFSLPLAVLMVIWSPLTGVAFYGLGELGLAGVGQGGIHALGNFIGGSRRPRPWPVPVCQVGQGCHREAWFCGPFTR